MLKGIKYINQGIKWIENIIHYKLYSRIRISGRRWFSILHRFSPVILKNPQLKMIKIRIKRRIKWLILKMLEVSLKQEIISIMMFRIKLWMLIRLIKLRVN